MTKAQKLVSYPILLSLFRIAQNRPYEPNVHVPFFLKPKATYAWQYFKSPIFIDNIKSSIYVGTIKSPS